MCYTNDTAILARRISRKVPTSELMALIYLNKYLIKWSIKVNESKCCCIGLQTVKPYTETIHQQEPVSCKIEV